MSGPSAKAMRLLNAFECASHRGSQPAEYEARMALCNHIAALERVADAVRADFDCYTGARTAAALAALDADKEQK